MIHMGLKKKDSDTDVTRTYEVIRVTGDSTEETTVEVCSESRIVLYLNGVVIGDLSITPIDLKPFVFGYLICEGYLTGIDQIEEITIGLPDIRVTASIDPENVPGCFSKNSSGGSCRDLLPANGQNELPDTLRLKSEMILRSMGHVDEYSVIWRRTGGMHCSLIIDENGDVVCGVEDMGRHTTVDKAVGMALLKGVNLQTCYLVCSGRLPVDMVAKAYRAGIQVMVSNNAAFAGGIEFAKKVNMTLAGFVRPPKMTIYTGRQRIVIQ